MQFNLLIFSFIASKFSIIVKSLSLHPGSRNPLMFYFSTCRVFFSTFRQLIQLEFILEYDNFTFIFLIVKKSIYRCMTCILEDTCNLPTQAGPASESNVTVSGRGTPIVCGLVADSLFHYILCPLPLSFWLLLLWWVLSKGGRVKIVCTLPFLTGSQLNIF